MGWLDTAAGLQQKLGYGISWLGSQLPGNVRAGQGGSSLGGNIASGTVSMSNAFPSLVKTANAASPSYDPYAGTQSLNPYGGTQSIPTGTTSGGGGGGVLGTQDTGGDGGGGGGGPSPEDILNSGYNDYFAQLDQLLGTLPSQQSNLENVATQQTEQQKSDIGLQKTQGEQQLQTYQNKSLKDISANIRNAFQSGNLLLGGRGAGESSAANQYAFALAKQGSKLRSDVMADVSNRMTNLSNIYNTEVNKLSSALSGKMSEIGQWFYEQQNALVGQKASAIKEKTQALLSYAVQQMGVAQQAVASQRSALDSWVANHATSIQSAIEQMRSYASNPNSVPTVSGAITDSYGGTQTPVATGYGANTTDKDIFGNPKR
jgi:hypothetical protein